MTLAKEAPAPAAPGPDAQRGAARRWHLLVPLAYLVVAIGAMKHLLLESANRITTGNARGQAFGEWMLVHGAHVLTKGAAPFLAGTMAQPDGTNPVATHGFLGLSIPLAPLTLTLGAARTFAIAVTLCLAGTAWAWYHVLDRHLVRNRTAAVVGGALGGFGPAMISHAQGDLARVALFLVPFLIWRTARLREPGRALRNGVVLGLLAAWQFLIDEEVLFLAVLAGAVYLLLYGLQRRHRIRAAAPAFLRGLGVAAVTWLIVVGYPLAVQLTQPRGVRPRVPVADHRTDVFSFFAFGHPSLGTWPVGQLHYAKLATEQHTFYGWPLLLLLLGSLWLVRGAVMRALAGTAALLGVLSLGNTIRFKDVTTHVPLPWKLVSGLPGLRSLAPTDLAWAALPVVVLIVALAVRRGSELAVAIGRTRPDAPVRLLWWGLLAAALLPIAPAPLHATSAPVPAFITAGTWRSYVPAGSSLLTVPPGVPLSATWRWAVATDLTLPTAEGTFNDLFTRAADSGKVQDVTERERQDAAALFRRDRVSVVVLAPRKNDAAIRDTTIALLGFPPQVVGGVWVWDLRGRT
jgi:hypothetical protein